MKINNSEISKKKLHQF